MPYPSTPISLQVCRNKYTCQTQHPAQKAYNVLKGANFTTILTDVVALEMSMEYGSLHQILNILNKADIQIEYMYAFPFKNKATAVIRTSDLEKTVLVLEQQSQRLLCENDINN